MSSSSGSTPGSNLGRYLADLAADPRRVRELQSDPEAAMNQAGLSNEEKSILRSKDRARIRDYLRRENPSLTEVGVIVVAIF